jgi:hypothetical protein
MRTLALAALCILAGCSSTPPSSETTTASTADAAPTATAAPAASAAPAAAATSAAASPATDAAKPFKPPAGYKTKIKDWDVVYCKKTPVLGSRFPQEVCMNEAQLKEHLAAMETMKRDKDQVSRVCSMAAGCANP